MGKAAGTMEGGGEGGQWLGYRILRVTTDRHSSYHTHREEQWHHTMLPEKELPQRTDVLCPRKYTNHRQSSRRSSTRVSMPVPGPYPSRTLLVPTPQTARNLSSSPVFNNPTSTADSALSAFLSGRWVLPSSFSHPRLPSFFFILSSFSASSSTSSILSLFLCCVVVCGRVSLSLSSIRLV